VDRACGTRGKDDKCIEFYSGNAKGRDHFLRPRHRMEGTFN
jgi:hypothetical protein